MRFNSRLNQTTPFVDACRLKGIVTWKRKTRPQQPDPTSTRLCLLWPLTTVLEQSLAHKFRRCLTVSPAETDCKISPLIDSIHRIYLTYFFTSHCPLFLLLYIFFLFKPPYGLLLRPSCCPPGERVFLYNKTCFSNVHDAWWSDFQCLLLKVY